MTSQHTSIIIQNISDHLASRDYTSAMSLLCSDQHRAIIYEHGWDLILPTLLALESDDAEDMEDGERLFNELISRGKQKEVLLSLVEHLSIIKSARMFDVALGGLQKILLSCPTRRTKLLQWVLPTIESYLRSLPYPRNHPLDRERERLLLDIDPAVQNITTSLSAVIDFLAPFVKEVGRKSCSMAAAERAGTDVPAQRELIQFHIASIIGHCAVLHVPCRPHQVISTMRVCAEKLVKSIALLSADLTALCFPARPEDRVAIQDTIDKDSEDEDDDDDSGDKDKYESKAIPQISQATLAYLLYVENIVPDKVPCVYSQRYIFEQNLGNIVHLLTYPGHLANLKGIALTKELVARQLHGQYRSLDLDNADLMMLFQQLTRLMIGSPLKDIRGAALGVFCRYLQIFAGDARYMIYCRLLKTEKHAGVLGFLLDHFRADLHNWKPSDKESENPFGGHNVIAVLKIVCVLTEKEETDLLGHSDCILAVLNLIRYIALTAQKHENHDVHAVFSMVEAYGDQLRKGLGYSKEHYKLKLQQLEKEMRGEIKRDSSDKLARVGDSMLPTLSPEQEVDVVKAALVRFDLLESVLVLAQDTLKASVRMT